MHDENEKLLQSFIKLFSIIRHTLQENSSIPHGSGVT